MTPASRITSANSFASADKSLSPERPQSDPGNGYFLHKERRDIDTFARLTKLFHRFPGTFRGVDRWTSDRIRIALAVGEVSLRQDDLNDLCNTLSIMFCIPLTETTD
jgi:hypothetical protein